MKRKQTEPMLRPNFIAGACGKSSVLFRTLCPPYGEYIEPIRGDGLMSMFGTKEKSGKYHAEITTGDWPVKGSEAVTSGSDEQVQKWASDPDCIEQEQAAAHMQWRLAERAKRKQELASKRQELQDNPFDPRTEVSADAKHIARKVVTHLWILFVALPLVLVVLYQILK
jgi:hypothetical protein